MLKHYVITPKRNKALFLLRYNAFGANLWAEVLIHNSSLQNGTLHNSAFPNGTLHNGTLLNGMLQNGTTLQKGIITKQ